MATVYIEGIFSADGSDSTLEIEGKTLREIVENLLTTSQISKKAFYFFPRNTFGEINIQGAIACINGQMAMTLEHHIDKKDEVRFLPAVAGG